MSKLRFLVAGVGGLVVVALVLLGGGWLWAGSAVDAVFDKTWDTHTVDFDVPFPLTEAPDVLEGVDLEALALASAEARGKHYAESIYACNVCHGEDLGGGTMIDEPAIGRVIGPNITGGGKTETYTVSDWDRAVRHGVLPNGKTSFMPVMDFQRMSDRELSDIIAYVRSVSHKPARGETIREWGPMGRILIATGRLVPDVEKVKDHQAAHVAEPPPVGPTHEYGQHIIGTCFGCHREGLNGGPMPFGPPDWPRASNLTPHADGLYGWSYTDFEKVMRGGIRKNGDPVRAPMVDILPNTARMTDHELEAMWAYLSAIRASPTGG